MTLSCKSMADTTRMGDFLAQFMSPQMTNSLFGFKFARGLPEPVRPSYNTQQEVTVEASLAVFSNFDYSSSGKDSILKSGSCMMNISLRATPKAF